MLQIAAGISDIANGLNRLPSVLSARAQLPSAGAERESVSLAVAGGVDAAPAEEVVVDLHEAAADAVAREIRAKLEDIALDILRLDVEMLLTMLGQGAQQAEEAAARATAAIEALLAEEERRELAAASSEPLATPVGVTLTVRTLEIRIDGATGEAAVAVTEVERAVSAGAAEAALGGVALEVSPGGTLRHAVASGEVSFAPDGPGVAEAFGAAMDATPAGPEAPRLTVRAVERAPDAGGLAVRLDADVTAHVDDGPRETVTDRRASGDLISVQA